MKGEERVCHVTEADRFGAARVVRLSEKCLHVRPPYGMGPRLRGGSVPLMRERGFAPVRGGIVRRFPGGTLGFRRNGSAEDQAQRRASGGCLGTERR